MRQDGYSEKDVGDSYAFLCVETETEVGAENLYSQRTEGGGGGGRGVISMTEVSILI